MSMKTEHTPTPWALDDGRQRQQDIIDRLTEDLPHPDRHWTAIGINDADGFAENLAYAHPINAPFIVRACNAHDELVTALEAIIACEPRAAFNRMAAIARAALAKAKGQQ